MTCIVALQHEGKVFVGGDAAATNTWSLSQITIARPKVFTKSDMIFGFAGSPRDMLTVQYKTHFDRWHPDVCLEEYMVCSVSEAIRNSLKAAGSVRIADSVETMDSVFLVAFRNELFAIYSDFSVIRSSDPFAAIGSGEDLALGSLYTSPPDMDPTQRVLKALEAAAKFNAGVKAPFTVKTFETEQRFEEAT